MIYAKSVSALDGNSRLTGARTAKQYLYDRYTCHNRQLKCYVPLACPQVYRDDWHCSGCDSNYHGERYCLSCRTGEYSRARSDAKNRTAEVAACAC
nr:hypothetical protein [Enterobacter cloacae]